MNGLFDFGALLNPQKAAVNPGAAPKAGPSPWYQSPKFWGDMGAALASGQRGGAAMAYAMKGQQGRAGLNAKLNFLRNAGAQPDEYVAKVDNQVLPLLRDTFGAAFTVKEGETLRATLGDPNKSPAEKKAVLRAFIEQKKRDVAALETRTNGVAETGIPDVKTLSDEQLRAIINGQ